VEDGEVTVTFTVVEKPEVQAIEFEGNRKYKEKDLLKELDFSVGDLLDRFAVNQGRENILRKYREAGYGDAEVEVDQDLLKSEQRVLYRIVEGGRIKVRRILFEGNETFSARELKGKIATKTYIWIFRTGAYDPDQVRQDEASLEKFYRDKGFLDVRVSSRLDFSDDRKDLTITFTIFEGTRYRIRNVNVRGNQVFTNEEILNEMRLLPEDYWDQETLDLSIKAITTLYGEDGYIYAEVVPERVFVADEPGYVNLNVSIVENEQVSVGRIVIRGNARTKDKVARRELEYYPEELYNITKVKKSEQNLRETAYFSDVTISPVGEEPSVRDSMVELVENDQTTRLLFGFGVGSNSGLVGQFVIENRNFDIADWPRSFGELFRGRAFRGAGQTLDPAVAGRTRHRVQPVDA
jgi:outer membrane protein insertion porin family